MPPVCAGPAGIVEQAIDAAEAVDRLADQGADIFLNRDVGPAKHAGRAELFGEPFALRCAAAGDNDFRAFRDKNLGGVQADAACRAGDNRDLPVQPSHVALLFDKVGSNISPAGRNNASHVWWRGIALDREWHFTRMRIMPGTRPGLAGPGKGPLPAIPAEQVFVLCLALFWMS
jgi:hypothetical protein